MKAVIVAAMLMACAVATPLEEHQRMFADFKSAHGRKYASEEEELKRFRVFSNNMKRAEELSRANPLARFGLTSVNLSPLSQVSKVHGYILAGYTGLDSVDLSPMVELRAVCEGFLEGCPSNTIIDNIPPLWGLHLGSC